MAVTARGTELATAVTETLLPRVRAWTAATMAFPFRAPWLPEGFISALAGAAAAGPARERDESMTTGMAAVATAASCLAPVAVGRGELMGAYLSFPLQMMPLGTMLLM